MLDGGESGKSAAGLEQLWRALAEARLERSDRVLAVGGGAVTDVVGFAAATFRRGLAWIAAPTTLVGQVDAAIGGKTAIDVAAKNDVGAFWTPQAVLADPGLLASLPAAEWSAGFAECAEDGAARRRPAVGARPAARRRAPERLGSRPSSCSAGPDSRRSSSRRTRASPACARSSTSATRSGTASSRLPATSNLRHGEAVSIGLVAALQALGASRGPGSRHRRRGRAAARRRRGCRRSAPGLAPAAVLEAMQHDKKRARGAHRFVLLERRRAAAASASRWRTIVLAEVVATAVVP